MKSLLASLLAITFLAVTACDNSTPGGPGATPPNANRSVNPSNGGTFTLSVSPESVALKQDEAKAFTVGIKRSDNFHEEVTLQFTGMPKGTRFDPGHPNIAQGDTEVKFTLKADDDAALGDFAVKMVGHPSNGVDSTNDIKITITKK